MNQEDFGREQIASGLASDWRPLSPTNWPDLTGAKYVGIDTETKDPNLLKSGPGFIRGESHVVGVSLAVPDGPSIYLPLRHEGGDNVDSVDNALSYIRDQVSGANNKVFANALYDIEALDSDGITVGGQWFDVQAAQPLLDEQFKGGYSLQNLSSFWLGEGKVMDLLEQAAEVYGLTNPRGELYKLPARYVGPYAEGDALQPPQILFKQMEELSNQDLLPVFNLETEILKVVWAMRKRGVRIDLDKAHQLQILWKSEQASLEHKLFSEVGEINVWSMLDLADICEKNGVWYPRTEKDNPSFEADWLANHKWEVLQTVARIRRVEKMRRDFIDKYLEQHINGRLHAQFHPQRREQYGTRSGRFSSSNPNLQQVPARDPEFGPALRGLFLPEEGEQWVAADYASQEPRLTVHYAHLLGLTGVADVVQAYRDNPLTDLHGMTAKLAGIERKQAKTINLGLAYGMSKGKLMRELGVDMGEANKIWDRYHKKVPFVRELYYKSMNKANSTGFVRTILGRRRRYTGQRDNRGQLMGSYRALNAVIQGSAADQNKMAMVNLYKMGFTPLLTVHDELAYSVSLQKDVDKIKYEMENAIKLEIPVIADVSLGSTWGEAK